jgi:hypothetical protein
MVAAAAGMRGVPSSRSIGEARAAAGMQMKTGGIEGLQWVPAETGSRAMGVTVGGAVISGTAGTVAGMAAAMGTGAEAGAAVGSVGVEWQVL